MKTKTETQEFNYVMGYAKGEFGESSGFAVSNPENTVRLAVDHSTPITLKRAKVIFDKARDLSGRDLTSIEICLSVYTKTPGNDCGDHSEECLVDKKWYYTAKTNSLVIWAKGMPVYANDNGVVCTDQAALYDSLC